MPECEYMNLNTLNVSALYLSANLYTQSCIPKSELSHNQVYGYVVEDGRYKQHLSDAQEFKEVPSSQTLNCS